MPCSRRRDTPGSPHTPVRIISAALSPIMMKKASTEEHARQALVWIGLKLPS